MISEAGSRIAKNSVFNLIRTCLSVPIMLIITPYVLGQLGTEEFGIWALVSVITSYAQLSDFGMTESLIRFTAEYKAKEDAVSLNSLLNTAMSVYAVIGALFVVVFYLLLPFVIEKVLNIPAPLVAIAREVFFLAVVLFFFSMIMGVFGSLIIGFQRMGQSNIISLAATIMTAAGTFYFLNQGYGLRGLVYNNAIITLFTGGAHVFVAWRLFPSLRINPYRYFRFTMLKTIFAFSWKVQISILSQLFVYQLDRIFLSRYLGLSSVAAYEVANRLATQARTFLASIFTPIIPAASTLHAQDDSTRIVGLYNRAFKYLAVTTIPFSFLVISLAHPFVRIWLGEGFEKTAVTIQCLMAAYLVNLVPGPGSFVLSGMNKPEITMKASVFAGGINLIGCIILVKTVGYYGVIIAITASLVISAGYFLLELHRAIPQLRWRLYGDAMITPIVVSSVLSAVLVCTQGLFEFRGYVVLVIASAIYLLLYAVTIVYKNDYLDEYDRALFQNLIKRPV